MIAGLEALNRPCEVQIVSDSKYVTDAFNKHWIDGWLKKGLEGSLRPRQKRGSVEAAAGSSKAATG